MIIITATLAGFIATFNSSINQLIEIYNSTVGWKTKEEKIINKLSVDARIEYFENVLGIAISKREKENGYEEYVFIRTDTSLMLWLTKKIGF